MSVLPLLLPWPSFKETSFFGPMPKKSAPQYQGRILETLFNLTTPSMGFSTPER
jgi:hypothetical protein